MMTQVKYVDFYQLEKTLKNGKKSCMHEEYDQCMYSALYDLMMKGTKSKCTVPWIPKNDKICTSPEDVNTTFWISWNHVTNQHNDCHSPCHRLLIDLGAKELTTLDDDSMATVLLYFPQKTLVSKEHFLYTILNLMAEFGGFTGFVNIAAFFTIAAFVNKHIDRFIERHNGEDSEYLKIS